VGELDTFRFASSTTLLAIVAAAVTFPDPLNAGDVQVTSPVIAIVLPVAKTVAVAAFPVQLPDEPVVFWSPVLLTPGKFMFTEPLKLTPPMVLAVASTVAVAALPVVLVEVVALPTKAAVTVVNVAVVPVNAPFRFVVPFTRSLYVNVLVVPMPTAPLNAAVVPASAAVKVFAPPIV
jgi:hypothetical protein